MKKRKKPLINSVRSCRLRKNLCEFLGGRSGTVGGRHAGGELGRRFSAIFVKFRTTGIYSRNGIYHHHHHHLSRRTALSLAHCGLKVFSRFYYLMFGALFPLYFRVRCY